MQETGDVALGPVGCSEREKNIILPCGFKITAIIDQPAEENTGASPSDPGGLRGILRHFLQVLSSD